MALSYGLIYFVRYFTSSVLPLPTSPVTIIEQCPFTKALKSFMTASSAYPSAIIFLSLSLLIAGVFLIAMDLLVLVTLSSITEIRKSSVSASSSGSLILKFLFARLAILVANVLTKVSDSLISGII